ncbi:MAG: hypothetical protein AAF565_15620, partial [Pseudomonadota bacterium]
MAALYWVLLVALVLAAFAGGWVLFRRLRLAEDEVARAEALSEGVLIRTEEYRIIDLSFEASRLPGAVHGGRIDELLSGLLDDGREEALSALDDLVRTGRPMRLLATDADGNPWELAGRPRGG